MLFQENKIKGRQADVMIAAYNAAEVALRLVKPGNEVSGDPTSVHLVSKRSWVQSPATTDESLLKKKKKMVVVAFPIGTQDYGNSTMTAQPVSG